MNFIDINELNISTELDVLKRDTQRHSFLFYQHKGEFFADNERIGNVNENITHSKFLKVLDRAMNINSDLVMSPEYSCPLSVINHVLENEEYQPPNNKIWALGGQSINLEELAVLRDYDNENIFIHFENAVFNTNKKYLDPLYYIFKGIHNEIPKLIILIQFKTKHMGVWSGGHLEANNLIEGNDIYIVKNSNISIRLMSFICSEAMNFRQNLTDQAKADIDWYDKPFLILNPQINPSPSHPTFIDFRKCVLENDKKELITLNWGIETSYNGHNWYSDSINSARSSVFFKTTSQELDYTNNRIIHNHNKGFYFLHNSRDKFVYFLNGIPELFQVENKPVDINTGVAPQRRREGPEAIRIDYFNQESQDFIELPSTEDKHLNFFRERGIMNIYLLNPENSIVDKERLINISTGEIIGKFENNWCEVIYLNSFNLKEANECNCRMTYVEDTHEASENIRNLNCTILTELDQVILNDKSLYPDSIEDLKDQNIILSYSHNARKYNYKYNLTDENGNLKKATICYLGNVSISRVRSTYDELQKLFEEGTEGKRRIVVFYKKGVNYVPKYDENAGSITNPSSDDSSIL